MARRLTPEIAIEWRRYARRVVTPPRLALAGWAVTVAVALLLESRAPCTVASPCPGNTAEPVAFTLLGTVVVGAFAAPRAGAVAAAALGVMGFWFDLDGRPTEARLLVYALFCGAAVWSVAAAAYALRGETEWRAFVEHNASPVLLPPEVARRPARAARVATAFAVLSLVAAAVLAQWVVAKVAAERRREAAAPVAEAVVERHDEGEVVLRSGDLRTTYAVYDTGDYPVGATVPVYVVGRSLRPVAEPYDAAWPAFLPCVAVALAALAAEEAVRARRAASRLARPVPAWSVARWVSSGGIPITARDPERAILRVKVGDVSAYLDDDEGSAELWDLGAALELRASVVAAGDLVPGGWVTVLANGVPIGTARALLAGRKRRGLRESL